MGRSRPTTPEFRSQASQLVDVHAAFVRQTRDSVYVRSPLVFETITTPRGNVVRRHPDIRLPRHDVLSDDEGTTISMPQWLAVQKGLL